MSLAHLTRAERLETFQRAVRDNVDMEEARRRIARDREAALRDRAAVRACGTSAPGMPSDAVEPAPARPEQWWQRL